MRVAAWQVEEQRCALLLFPHPQIFKGIKEAAATDCSDNLPERYITQKKDNGKILSPICPERVGLLLKNFTWKSQVVLASWYIQVEVLCFDQSG
jgi:hypothetical protein